MEVNEKDLTDQGININPSELDILLPVINPTQRPTPTLKTLKPFFTPNYMPEASIFNTIKDMLETGSVSKKNKPKHLARIDSSQKPPNSKLRPQDLHSNNTTQAKMNLKQKLVRFSNTNTTKNDKLHPKQPYYNVYDADKPVTIKIAEKHEEVLPKDKQESLNNTLAVYGLRLDPKGKYVILQDSADHSGTARSKNGIGNEKMKEQEGINVKIAKKEKGKKPLKHSKIKNVDTIKSLWSILQSVSKKWK